jgi:Na+-driven multidrug efflux pump
MSTTLLGVRAFAQPPSSSDLARRMTERRAVEAVIWGMPAVNAERMFEAMKNAKQISIRSFIGVLVLVGAVFVFWTDTGVVAISWLIGLGELLIGGLLIYLATRVKRLQAKIDSIGDRS